MANPDLRAALKQCVAVEHGWHGNEDNHTLSATIFFGRFDPRPAISWSPHGVNASGSLSDVLIDYLVDSVRKAPKTGAKTASVEIIEDSTSSDGQLDLSDALVIERKRAEELRAALDRIVAHDPKTPGLHYDSLEQLLESLMHIAHDAIASDTPEVAPADLTL